MDSDFWTSRLAAAKRQYNLQHRHQTSQLDRLSIDDFEVDDEFPCPYCYEDFDIASLCSHLEDDHPCESKVTSDRVYMQREVLPLDLEDLGCRTGIENEHRVCAIAKGDYHPISLKALPSHPICSEDSIRVQICPVCYVKVARDMLSHFTLQHGNLFKISSDNETSRLLRRRRLCRVAIPSSQALSLLGRDLREAHLQVLLGGGAYRPSSVNASSAATDSFLSSLIMNFPASEAEEITKSVVTSFEDTKTKNAAPAHMWKSSFDPSLSNEELEKWIRQATGRAGIVQDLVLTTLLKE
ncbi:protein DEHYDRATION-INDUCED 19-like isoform 2 [Hibiscus syriacus]|uniref:Protein DEHYDRATION-INDUCED 19-like isoform 2 n=1 Tax=Hibiscus syriacus TaxID=106335 RepID=A0A6A3CQT9_HIBSY|nr:protein DEHYDRATION-INDUCED 19-like isoform 2 [Hibiscus syriacus]